MCTCSMSAQGISGSIIDHSRLAYHCALAKPHDRVLAAAQPVCRLGFPEESEQFCTLDDLSLLDKHLRALSKDATDMRIRASASHDAST